MNCPAMIRIKGDRFKILIKGYDLCTKRLPIKSRSSLRKIVERYVVNSDVERATDKLYDVTEFIRRLRIKGGPRYRFLLVRICSALGYGTKECLKDIWPSFISRGHEYLLYGMVFPGLDIKADGCKFYKEWTEDVLDQCGTCDYIVAHNNEYWEEYWRKNKTLPITLKNEELEEE